jgi:5'-phosphate synthase pdxT subunit
MKVGILALQGAVQDHIAPFSRLGAETAEIRRPEELDAVDALVIPGGESTVMGRFLRDYSLIEPIRRRAAEGMPIWGLCAGAIVLCESVDGKPGALSLLPASAERNAYGRQLASFEEVVDTNLGPFPGIFIRAPRLLPRDGTEVLARRRQQSSPHQGEEGEAVLFRYRKILAASFHPELSGDDRLHAFFLSLV